MTVRRAAREALALLLRCTGVNGVVRRLRARRGATIIVYHDPAPETLRRHLQRLSRDYHFVPMQRLVAAIRQRDWSTMPPNALVVAFDDGHAGNHRLLETLREFRVHPIIYLCSQVVNTRRRFWWKAGAAEVESLKALAYDDMLARLQERCGYRPEKEWEDRQALNMDELRELSAHADLGAHSRHHPVLVRCSEAQCRGEIAGSKTEIEAALARAVDHFAYPNGEYSEREVQLVKDAGFASARTLDPGWNDVRTDPYRLRAMYIDDDASINVLLAKAGGVFPRLRRLMRRDPRRAAREAS